MNKPLDHEALRRAAAPTLLARLGAALAQRPGSSGQAMLGDLNAHLLRDLGIAPDHAQRPTRRSGHAR